MGLVAGNVTGGGGKATKKRPNGIVPSGTKQVDSSSWMLTGDGSPQRVFGIQNRWFERVHARTTKPLRPLRRLEKKIKALKRAIGTTLLFCLKIPLFANLHLRT